MSCFDQYFHAEWNLTAKYFPNPQTSWYSSSRTQRCGPMWVFLLFYLDQAQPYITQEEKKLLHNFFKHNWNWMLLLFPHFYCDHRSLLISATWWPVKTIKKSSWVWWCEWLRNQSFRYRTCSSAVSYPLVCNSPRFLKNYQKLHCRRRSHSLRISCFDFFLSTHLTVHLSVRLHR